MSSRAAYIKKTLKKNIQLLCLHALIVAVFFTTVLASQSAQAQLRCSQLFADSVSGLNVENLAPNKYEKLAEDLGLTYLKAPIPQGYRRAILSSRQYTKKDGSPGAKINYYRYYRPDGSLIRPRVDAEEYHEVTSEFKKFKIDEDWTDVWLSADKNTHIQVIGKTIDSETGKTESVVLYHPKWTLGASKAKFIRVQAFGDYVEVLRKKFIEDINKPNSVRNYKTRSEAAAFLLLMSGRIRVGHQKYLEENGTAGVTTLQKDQVILDKNKRVFLKYIGKSGNKDLENPVVTTLEITDPELKKVLVQLKNTNPQDPRLFAGLSANSLNEKLNELVSEISLTEAKFNKKNSFTVKDFRTWAATVKTVQELILSGPPPTDPTRKDLIFRAVAKNVARLLNNTVGIARKDYIDPRILNAEAYDQLWALFLRDFPDLQKITDDNIESSEAELSQKEKYNPQFEKLALQFLQNIESANNL